MVSGLLTSTKSPYSDSVSLRLPHKVKLANASNSLTHYTKGTQSHNKYAPTACTHAVSGSISLPSPGFFSPFPHGTGSLSVAGEYLALGGGPPGFPRGFTCPVVLGIPLGRLCGFAYGAFTLCGRPFQAVPLPLRLPFIEVPQPRVRFPEPGLGCSPFARRYLGSLF